MKRKAKNLSPALWEAVYSGLRCRKCSFQTISGAPVAVWHPVTSKIQVLWTNAALRAGVDRCVYEKWLGWYGKEARKGLWWPLLKAHRMQRAALAGTSPSADGDVAGSSGSDCGGEKSEEEGH